MLTPVLRAQRNNKLVWDESIRIMIDMFENIWGTQNTIIVDHCVDITLPIALFVIGVAGARACKVTVHPIDARCL